MGGELMGKRQYKSNLVAEAESFSESRALGKPLLKISGGQWT